MPQMACRFPLQTLNPGELPQNQAIPELLFPIGPEPPLPAWDYPQWINDFSLTDQLTLLWLATLTRATYSADGGFFVSAANAVLPNSYPKTFVSNTSGLVPGYGFIQLPHVALLVISGTTNLSQWADQIFLGNLTPTNFAPSGQQDNGHALSTYITAANAIDAAISALTPANSPIIIVGHSLGGAVAQVLAYKYSWTTRQTQTKVCAFAPPKAGDASMANGVYRPGERTRRFKLAGDFVPSLPPALSKAAAFLVPQPFTGRAFQWASYVQVGQLYSISAAGNINAIDDSDFFVQAATAYLAAFAGLPINLVSSHMMATFVNNFRAAFGDSSSLFKAGFINPSQLDTINDQMTAAGL